MRFIWIVEIIRSNSLAAMWSLIVFGKAGGWRWWKWSMWYMLNRCFSAGSAWLLQPCVSVQFQPSKSSWKLCGHLTLVLYTLLSKPCELWKCCMVYWSFCIGLVSRFCFDCIDNWSTVSNLCPLCKLQFRFISVSYNAYAYTWSYGYWIFEVIICSFFVSTFWLPDYISHLLVGYCTFSICGAVASK